LSDDWLALVARRCGVTLPGAPQPAVQSHGDDEDGGERCSGAVAHER
jgi:hypothetical protein